MTKTPKEINPTTKLNYKIIQAKSKLILLKVNFKAIAILTPGKINNYKTIPQFWLESKKMIKDKLALNSAFQSIKSTKTE